MFSGNIKMALGSIRRARWRSFLTMLGVIIGIAAVVTIVSLGEGVKRQMVSQINHLGPHVVTIRAGSIVSRDKMGTVKKVNVTALFGGGTLSEKDLTTAQKTDGIKVAVPANLVTATVTADKKTYGDISIVGTTSGMPEILNQKIATPGAFFASEDSDKTIAVLGRNVAENLFGEASPVGHTFELNGTEFRVVGVFEKFSENPLNFGVNYNETIFIPYSMSKAISGGSTQIREIYAKTTATANIPATLSGLQNNLAASRGSQQDFTILRQSDYVGIADNVFTILTGFVAGVAALSLLVGGIGIMNIMLVSVTERTREIGLRKAIGATRGQIISQFMIEAIVLCVVGGIIGILVSLALAGLIHIFTSYRPVINVPVIVIASGVSVMAGVLFGIIPAVQAARKDPIEALRHE